MKDIELGVGIGELKFGMSPDNVLEILGQPDEKNREVYSKDDPDFFTEEWHYDELEMSLSFDMIEVMELSTISVSSSAYLLEGISLIGEKRERVEEIIKELKLDTRWEEYKQVEENGDLLTNENEGLSFWFEEGILREIQWETL